MSLLLLAQAAFPCPTVATGTPSALSFDTAQVAIVRQGRDTTFSVSINPLGDPQDFALVLPVPVLLAESDIQTLDTEIFARLDGYSAPRHVSDAGCSNAYYAPEDGGASDTAGMSEGDAGVDIEATYLVGDYEIVILSAEESSALYTWLNDNGYHLVDGAEERLAEYIEAGSLFLAAKVAPEAAVASGEPLAPLQIHYQSDVFAIPIRLATLNSPGQQDMIIYALTETNGDAAAGRVGVSNYPEFEVAKGCRWSDSNDDFAAFYESRFEKDWDFQGAGAWTVEFAGDWYSCNPCTNTNITEEDIASLGFTGRPDNHFLTRIRMRYTPEQATSDLVLYGSGLTEPMVTAYADNVAGNDCIEADCDDIPAGSTELPEPPVNTDGDALRDGSDAGGCGCNPISAGANWGTLAGAAALFAGSAARRRR
jgi:hypothetical protein